MFHTPFKTFIIYARNDKAHKEELLGHLKPLVSARMLNVWHDGDILPGEEWEATIKKNLKDSPIILVLVSVHCLKSDFILIDEMNEALEQVQQGNARIIPIIVSHCGWKYMPTFRDLQVLPEEAKPITKWDNRDEAWTNVIDGIAAMVVNIQNEKAEKVRLEKIAAEKAEKERLEKIAAEKAEKERLEKMSLERITVEKDNGILYYWSKYSVIIILGLMLLVLLVPATIWGIALTEIHKGKDLYTKKEYSQAFLLLSKHQESEEFDIHAQNCLGLMYYYGQGIKQNYREAIKYFTKTAKQGSPYAQNYLAYMYEMGYGVTINKTAAIYWYRLSAKGGNKSAQENLTRLGEKW